MNENKYYNHTSYCIIRNTFSCIREMFVDIIHLLIVQDDV